MPTSHKGCKDEKGRPALLPQTSLKSAFSGRAPQNSVKPTKMWSCSILSGRTHHIQTYLMTLLFHGIGNLYLQHPDQAEALSKSKEDKQIFVSEQRVPCPQSSGIPLPPTFFWPHHTSCRILVPQLEIKPGPTTVRTPSPNYWTDTEVQGSPKFIRGLSANNPDQLSPRAKVSLLFYTV